MPPEGRRDSRALRSAFRYNLRRSGDEHTSHRRGRCRSFPGTANGKNLAFQKPPSRRARIGLCPLPAGFLLHLANGWIGIFIEFLNLERREPRRSVTHLAMRPERRECERQGLQYSPPYSLPIRIADSIGRSRKTSLGRLRYLCCWLPESWLPENWLPESWLPQAQASASR